MLMNESNHLMMLMCASALVQFNGEDITTISPTLGFNINTLEYRGYLLNVWVSRCSCSATLGTTS
jgi:ADP-ribosylation factor family